MLSRSAASRMLRSRSDKMSFRRKRGDTGGTNPASHGLSRLPFSGWAGSESSVMSSGCEPVLDRVTPSQLPESSSGPGGRRFESCLPDQYKAAIRFGNSDRVRPALFGTAGFWDTGGPNHDGIGAGFADCRSLKRARIGRQTRGRNQGVAGSPALA